MSAASRIARSTAILTVAQGVTMAINLGLWVHLGRTLGPDGFGVVGLGMALLSYFVLAVTLGFDAVGIREIARRPERTHTIVHHALGFRIVLGLAATAGFSLVAILVAPDTAVRVTLLVLGFQILARAIQIDWVYQAQERMGFVAVRNMGAAACAALLALVFVRQPEDLVLAAMALSVAQWVASLGILGAYSREAGLPRPSRSLRAWKVLLIPALPLAATSFASQVYFNADKLMLAWLQTTTEVGLYEAAYKVFALAVVGSSILYPAFFPALSAAFGDEVAMRERSRAFSSALVAIGLPLTAAGILLAPLFIELLFDAAYADASPALRLLFGAAGITYISLGFGAPLMAWDREKDYMKAILAGSAINVVLNVALIPPFGVVGAASATLLSEAFVLAGMAFRFRRETGTVYPSILIRGVVCGIVGGVLPSWIALAQAWSLFPALAAVAFSSLLSAWATGLMTPQNVRDILDRSSNRS